MNGTSVLDLNRIIEQDPGLTTRLLKMVNSAYFGRRNKISSISHAIIMAGFKRVRLMALNISLRDTFPLGRVGGMDYDLFWKTSLYRAMIAQGFSQTGPMAEELDPEEIFTAGLILEIGMLLLFHICPPVQKEAFPGGGTALLDLIAWENEHLGINHREVGRIILHRWNFSEPIVESQKYFGPEALQADRSPQVRILEFARICTQIFFGSQDDFHMLDSLAKAQGISPEILMDILVTTFSRVEEVAGQLRLMINSQDDLLLVMEKANRTLAKINGSLESSFVKVFNLITDLEQSAVQEPSEEQEEKNRLLENTLEAVVHEIRNPLMAIGGFAHRLAKNVEQRGDVIEYVHLITKESLRLEKVMKDLVAYSQIYKPFIITRNIVQVVEKVLASRQELLDEKNIRLIRLYPPAPILIPLDEAEITKALQCLLETEIQILEKMDRQLWIGLEKASENREIRISLSTKAGQFPEELRLTLLGKDFSGRAFGLGLGLSLARKIIAAHGGRLELTMENELNTLSIYLPVSIG